MFHKSYYTFVLMKLTTLPIVQIEPSLIQRCKIWSHIQLNFNAPIHSLFNALLNLVVAFPVDFDQIRGHFLIVIILIVYVTINRRLPVSLTQRF